MLSFGAKLRYYRKRANQTQDKLGKLCGISGKAISRYENNISQPDIETIKKIAEIYQTDVNDLLGYNRSGKNEYDMNLTGLESELVQKYRKLPNRMKVIFRNMLKPFSDERNSLGDDESIYSKTN